MSQKKVDKYKEYKRNRREILKKEKRKAMAAKALVWVVVLAVAGGLLFLIGNKAYESYKSYRAKQPVYTAEEYIIPDLAGVLSTETETEPTTEPASTKEAATEPSQSAEETSAEAQTSTVEETTSEETANEAASTEEETAQAEEETVIETATGAAQ